MRPSAAASPPANHHDTCCEEHGQRQPPRIGDQDSSSQDDAAVRRSVTLCSSVIRIEVQPRPSHAPIAIGSSGERRAGMSRGRSVRMRSFELGQPWSSISFVMRTVDRPTSATSILPYTDSENAWKSGGGRIVRVRNRGIRKSDETDGNRYSGPRPEVGAERV